MLIVDLQIAAFWTCTRTDHMSTACDRHTTSGCTQTSASSHFASPMPWIFYQFSVASKRGKTRILPATRWLGPVKSLELWNHTFPGMLKTLSSWCMTRQAKYRPHWALRGKLAPRRDAAPAKPSRWRNPPAACFRLQHGERVIENKQKATRKT